MSHSLSTICVGIFSQSSESNNAINYIENVTQGDHVKKTNKYSLFHLELLKYMFFQNIQYFITNLMVARLVAAAVSCTSGGVVRDRIGGVGQVLPEPSVHILLHQWIDEKTGESVQGYHRLHKEKTLHFQWLQYSLKKIF